jgi:hypothetical protein
MKTPLVPLTLADIEDSIYAIKAYQRDNVRHPGLSARQRWHRLSNTLAKLEQARDTILAEPRAPFDPRPPCAEVAPAWDEGLAHRVRPLATDDALGG